MIYAPLEVVMNLLPTFMITGLITLLAAIAMVATRNMVYSAIYMVIVFLATAVLYLIYQAPLIAMLQITVYAGGIMVLFIFVIMLMGAEKTSHIEHLRRQRPLAFILAVSLSAEVIYLAFRQSPPLTAVEVDPDFGGPLAIGLMVFKDYVLPFEVVSVLLLVAMIGAIVLTIRQDKKK